MSRVVVVGGGVIGCAVAELLSLQRHKVTLLERDHLGGRASGAAAGELSPSSLPSDSESLAMFPDLVSRIEKDSAMNVEYRVQQGLLVAFTDEEMAALRPSGTPGHRPMNNEEVRRIEPALTHEAVGALLIEHAHLTPPRFVRALARSAAAHGAEICEGTPASGFDIEGGEVRSVRTPMERIGADWVVIAAGPWTREVASAAGIDVDVRPQRGQLAALSWGSVVLRRSIFWSNGYLVPKADGTIIAGGTEEDSGFDDQPTLAGMASLLELARKLVPGLAAASLVRVWAGLRPVTSSGTPIVAVSSVKNLIIATGHHRKGILLAPLAAVSVARLLS